MKPKVYCAVPIRGAKGDLATVEDMDRNCQIAKKNMEVLSLIFPQVDWICVAAYDKVVQKLYKKGYVTVDQILECDFEIIEEVKNVLCHLWEPSNGAEREYQKSLDSGGVALKLHDPPEIWMNDMRAIKHFVDEVESRAMEGYLSSLFTCTESLSGYKPLEAIDTSSNNI